MSIVNPPPKKEKSSKNSKCIVAWILFFLFALRCSHDIIPSTPLDVLFTIMLGSSFYIWDGASTVALRCLSIIMKLEDYRKSLFRKLPFAATSDTTLGATWGLFGHSIEHSIRYVAVHHFFLFPTAHDIRGVPDSVMLLRPWGPLYNT